MSTSSMLKKRLRKELGYIYNCDVSLDSSIPYKGCGTFNIRYYVNSQHIEDSIIEVFSILKNISTHDIDKLLDMSKKCIINNLKIKCENIESFADINSINLMLTNKYFKLEKEIKDISKINTGDILNVINHLLSHKIVISVVGKKINRNKLRNSLESIIV
jgi:predicted Zn-dependent peptidase